VEVMADKLIKADDARRAILKEAPHLAYIIDNLPGVEVVLGRWIDVNGRKYLGSYCSHCNKWCDYKYNYRPNCGADMRGEEDGK
jgi:hypothetical protein